MCKTSNDRNADTQIKFFMETLEKSRVSFAMTRKVSRLLRMIALYFLCFLLVFNCNFVNRKDTNSMKTKCIKTLIIGVVYTIAFVIWTILIQIVDVKAVGVSGTNVGFATLNAYFHSLTGINITLYNITDWLGLVPIFVCVIFGVIGLVQLIKRKSLLGVDFDIIILGVYYVIVMLCYLVFEMFPINYRPILINGFMEASFPSSTTLLVLCVMPTLVFQVNRRLKNKKIKNFIYVITVLFSVFMVIGRLISGVHWITDIVGSIILSTGLFYVYKGVVLWNLMKNFRN